MEVKQVYELVNKSMQEVLGEVNVEDAPTLTENMDNIVDMGNTIQNVLKLDNYVRSLVNHIGKVIFVNRPYSGSAPSVLMDGWEYGSILEKIQSEMPIARENESWELQDGKSYDPNIFYQPKASAKFFNKRTTFEIDQSITERQVKESFSNATQLNAFISMLYNEVDKSMTVKTDELIMRTINTMTAHTIAANGTGLRVVNLLTMYNAQSGGTALTPQQAIYSPEFIRFASYQIGLYVNRINKISRLFNIGEKARFTPTDRLHLIMLSEFEMAANVYLQSDVYHNEYTRLPMAESVPYWQGSGTNYSFTNTSSIAVTINDSEGSATQVKQSGILAVMFDRDALGVTNLDRRVTTNYNPKAEFWTNFHKFEAGYFADLDENFIVFLAA